jgi:hypothetical protein
MNLTKESWATWGCSAAAPTCVSINQGQTMGRGGGNGKVTASSGVKQ